MDDYVSKPIMIEEIQRMIEKWSKKPNKEVKNSRKIIYTEDDLIDQDAMSRLKEINDKVDPEFLEKVIGMFFEQAPQLVEEIRSHELKNEWELLGQKAHKLKGTSLNLGARILAEVSKQLEIKGRNKDITNIGDLVEELAQIYKLTESELKKNLVV